MEKSKRYCELDIPIFAVTGGMGTGKSTLIRHLRASGRPCLEADQLIKLIYEREETKKWIASLGEHFIKGAGWILPPKTSVLER